MNKELQEIAWLLFLCFVPVAIIMRVCIAIWKASERRRGNDPDALLDDAHKNLYTPNEHLKFESLPKSGQITVYVLYAFGAFGVLWLLYQSG